MNRFKGTGSIITYFLDKGLIKNHKSDDIGLNDKIFDIFTNIFSIIASLIYFVVTTKIKFTAFYNGQRRTFNIDPVSGSNGLWHLYIDNRYYGGFSIHQGDWVFKPQKDDYFTAEQIEMLVDMVRIQSPIKGGQDSLDHLNKQNAMEPLWKRKKEDPERNAKIVYAKDAYNANCWILSTATGKIYTPREFIECKERIDFHRGREVDGRFKIVDPRDWIQKSMVDLVNKTTEITILQKKINEYFDIKPKPKQNNR